MNLLQAIEQAGDNWFRPVGFYRKAFAINKNGNEIFFMGNTMQSNQLCFKVKELTGEWEIVTPEQVMAERK